MELDLWVLYLDFGTILVDLFILLGSLLIKKQIVQIASKSIWLYSYMFNRDFQDADNRFMDNKIWDGPTLLLECDLIFCSNFPIVFHFTIYIYIYIYWTYIIIYQKKKKIPQSTSIKPPRDPSSIKRKRININEDSSLASFGIFLCKSSERGKNTFTLHFWKTSFKNH